jgi:serine/threonine protein kinase/tetratricopeptide (TPR) repeat protein
MVPRLVSHYRIIKKIGSGGMCDVYLAKDAVLKRKVALKVLSEKRISSRDAVKRFTKEAESTARLDHPNICSIYEVGNDGGLHFIAMQYIEGHTLAERMKTAQLGLESIINIAAQVADALTEADAKGIIHRDIKPQNIMITPGGAVKVLDFGLAKVTNERSLVDSRQQTQSVLTRPGTLVGTVPYFSPEQARGEQIDSRSDIFSLGIVIYEMLSRTHPFKGPSEAVMLSLILTEEPPPLTQFLPAAPAELQQIVSKALCKRREHRYQTAQELRIDLLRLKQDLTSDERMASCELSPLEVATRTFPDVDHADSTGGRTRFTDKTVATPRPNSLSTLSRNPVVKLVALAVFLGLIALAVAKFYFSAKPVDSVAILPFTFSTADNSPSDPEADYLSEGLTESIINNLSQSSSLKVIARSSVFRFKGKQIDPQEVGRELGVRTVFVGRITRHGDNITIKADLSDVLDNRQIWGEQYERKSSDLLGLQREIARDIINNLRLKFGQDEEKRLNKSYTDNGEAYELYLKGRYYWNKRTEDGFRKAIDFFQKAIDKDPNYAQADTGLADSYMLLSDWGFMTPLEGYSKARDAVVRALLIDDQLAEAHNSLAGIKGVLDWDWPGAESEYRKAITLNPNYATAHHWYALQLMLMGRTDESLAEIKQAQRLDPLSLGINKDFAVLLIWARRYDDALEQCRKTLEIDSTFLTMYPVMAQAYEGKQMNGEAVTQLQKAHGWSPDDQEISISLAQAHALAGMKTEAQRILNELDKPPKEHQNLPNEMALLYALLGSKDQAFEILQKAYENHYFVVSEVKTDPRFEVLRSDSRYADLLRRIRLQ